MSTPDTAAEHDVPGRAVAITIPWKGYTTLARGLVACTTPNGDTKQGFGPWELAHAPTGLVIAHFEGPEQAQAAAAKLTDIDWLNLDPADVEAKAAIAQQVIAAVNSVGGNRPVGFKVPMWSAGAEGSHD